MSYFIVNKTTGAMRPYAPDEAAPQKDSTLTQRAEYSDEGPTLGESAAAQGLEETEVLIDTSREVYNPTTGEIIPVPQRARVNPTNIPARLAALESRIATLEATVATQADRITNLEVELIEVAGYAAKKG